ncbi:MAG: Calx-beta domain-containing protein, partial [Verrucomicrobiales bacterium]|nr:Calx-beta domain-containing protein [Verrucomicrobiales bacterium]
TGAGVPVTIVEAENSDNYLPQGGSSPISGSGNYSGKTFTDKTLTPADQSTGTSGHAGGVASFYFGNSSSIAPGITEIDCYNANDWVDNAALRTGTILAPRTELSDVQNHSWIGSTGSNATDQALLQRLDFLIERDRVIACVGLNNGSGSSVPKLLAPAFNSISVGRTDGAHSTGTTPGGLSTPGRTRPDIVAPAGVTSHATPMVSAAAALLVSSPGGGNRSTVVYKSILLAGATKHQIPGWTSTPNQPLDPHFGVGQLDIYNSYHILEAGEQNRSATTNRSSTGWDRTSSLTPGTANTYFFEIPAGGTASEFSAVLTWNRTVTDTAAGLSFSPSETLHDLTLTLEQSNGDFIPIATVTTSDSPVDNVEHIYTRDLAPGQYCLSVNGDSSKEYAVAWRTTLAPELTLADTAVTIGESATAASLTVSLDQPTLLPVTIRLTTTRGTASDNDFTPLVATTFTIPVGTTTLDIPIAISPDTTHELDENFTVTLSDPTNATLTGASVATVTITDDDPEPTLAITAPTPTSEAAPTLNFTLALSNPSYLDVTVETSTTDMAATADDDFTAITSETVTISAGSTSADIPVLLTQDDTHEAEETLALTLANPRNTTLTTATATATITDDDPVPTLTLTAPPATPEAAAEITFTLTLSNPTHLDTTAAFTTTDATAIAGTDYTTITDNLTIPAGSLTTTVTVGLLDDTEPEADQSFTLDLTNIHNATPTDTTVTATLLDDDFPLALQSLASNPNPAATSTILSWLAVLGRNYRIEISSDLRHWTTFTSLSADQSPVTVTIPLTENPLFFRILDVSNP